jgi:pimeloyl-ACP methyl ester carboxylesterase
MRKKIRILLAAVFCTTTLRAESPKFTPHEYVAADGTKVSAELGEFSVPENRSNPGSHAITLRFVRFKSTAAKPGSPIVYLAGGPGGSGIEALRGTRFPLAMALREFGDVIAFDQRGVNKSGPDMRCNEPFLLPFDKPLDRTTGGPIMAAATRKCAERLRASGVDVSAYNTRESAADLDDLRKALGAEKLVLWAISYGTHLSIAALRYYPQSIDKVILAGIEGPDDTYKLPSDQQALIEEIARLAAHDGKSPDLVASIRNVLRELEARPKTVSLTHPMNGMTANVTVGKLDFQVALTDMLFAPDTFAGLPDFVTRVEKGDWTALALAAAQRRMGDAGSMMSTAMDCASGISASRKALIAGEAKRTLLGDAINAPFPEVCAGLEIPDLGDDFRAPLASDVRALIISGTLDGRTRPRQADELRRMMPHAEHLVIEGAGHSDPLFLSTPKILEAMKAFLRGEPLRERYVAAPPVRFIPIRTVANVSDDVLARYAGSYRIDDKTVRRVVKAGSVLYTIRGNNPPLAIRPSSDTEFFYEAIPGAVHFEIDGKGNVTGMVVTQPNGQKDRAPRMP